jgi:hypothetical protein
VAALFGVLLFGVPGLFSIPAEQILLNPTAYKQALAAQNVYEQAPALLGSLLAQSSNRAIPGSGDQILAALQGARFDAVMRQVFPPDWIQSQAEGLIDQFWAFFNLRSPEFHLLVDLRPVKQHLTGPDSPQIISAIVQGLPACSANDLLDFTLKAVSGEAQGLPMCRPPDAFLSLTNQLVGGMLGGAAGLLPDQMDLASGLTIARLFSSTRPAQNLQLGFRLYRVWRQANPFLPWVALGFLALLLWLSLRTPQGPLFWGGAALLLPGLLVLFLAILAGAWLVRFIPSVLIRITGDHLTILDALVAALGQVTGRFTLAVVISALVVMVLGLLLLGLSIYQRELVRKSAAGTSPEVDKEA